MIPVRGPRRLPSLPMPKAGSAYDKALKQFTVVYFVLSVLSQCFIIIIILYYAIYGSTHAHKHGQLTAKIHQKYV